MRFSYDFLKILNEGGTIFTRNSATTIGIITLTSITLFLLGMIVFLDSVLNISISKIEDRVDINIGMFPEVTDEETKSLRDIIVSYPEVADAQISTRKEILESFQERHSGNYLIMQSLKEIRSNPFGATINVRAIDPEYYEAIAKKIYENPRYGDTVEKINYYQNQTIIEKLRHVSETILRIGGFVILIIGAVATILIFNATRLAIATSRGDIKTKILLGSEPRFIRGPFLMAGLLNAVAATIIAVLGLYFLIQLFATEMGEFLGTFDLNVYFINSLPQTIILLLSVGIILSMVAALISVSIVSTQK